MNNILLYFLKSGIAMALFFGIYRIFLEKETNYSLNRFYLIGSIIFSLLLPILPLENLFIVKQNLSMPTFFISEEVSNAEIGMNSGTAETFRISGLFLARIIYLCGMGLLFMTLIIQTFRLVFLKREGKEQYGDMKVFYVNKDILPFSIFNMVFVNQEIRKDPKLNTILKHEYAHYRNLHFVDLFILEIVTIFQWFNPFAWLYVRALKEIHEYQADDAVLRGGEGTGNYQALLVNQLTGTEVFRLSSAFSKSLTKKRMIMMTKIKSKNGTWLKSLIAIPVLAILMIAFSANSNSASGGQESYTISGKVVEAATGQALSGAAIILQGTSTGTVSDMKGNFSLEVKDKNAVLVFSYVGLQTVKESWQGKDLLVKMERENYEIPEDAGEVKDAPGGQEYEKTLSDEVFFVVEEMPSFQGKQAKAAVREYVQGHVEYPPKAKKNKIQGNVFVEFIVGSDGIVRDAKIARGVDPELDKAALEVVNSMPAWEPGRQRGTAVAVQFTVPVVFALGGE